MVFCCKQKTAYEVRTSDWSSDVCSSDLSCSESAVQRPVRHWHRFLPGRSVDLPCLAVKPTRCREEQARMHRGSGSFVGEGGPCQARRSRRRTEVSRVSASHSRLPRTGP